MTAPLPAMAEGPQFNCQGTMPAWSMEVTGDTAVFDYVGQTAMTIPQNARAEGRAWPWAMTLVSEDYQRTAIVLLHERSCDDGTGSLLPYEMQVLTQRTDQPVLLTGCCRLP